MLRLLPAEKHLSLPFLRIPSLQAVGTVQQRLVQVVWMAPMCRVQLLLIVCRVLLLLPCMLMPLEMLALVTLYFMMPCLCLGKEGQV